MKLLQHIRTFSGHSVSAMFGSASSSPSLSLVPRLLLLFLFLLLPLTVCPHQTSKQTHSQHHHHDAHNSHSHSHDTHNHQHHSPVLLNKIIQRILLPLQTLPASTAAYTASALVSTTSLVSLLILPFTPILTPFLLPFAAGALLSDVFQHLLPQIYTTSTPSSHANPLISTALLLSAAIFFILDAFLRRLNPNHHHHLHHDHSHSPINPNISTAYINLAADALHNFCDGLSIGAAFLSSPTTGIATTVAVILHELPQELADYAVLLRAGFSRSTALAANLVCACTALAGTAAALRAAQMFKEADAFVLPFAAGALLYMTFVAVIPDVLEDVNAPLAANRGEKRVSAGLFLVRLIVALLAAACGVFVVSLVESLHEH